MIFIIHGENYAKSRKLIGEIKDKVKAQNITELTIDTTNPAQLADALNSSDMFGNMPFVVFDISGAGRKNVDDYIEVATKTHEKTMLLIISSKELSAANAFIKNSVKLAAKVVNNTMLQSSNIFAFADNVFALKRTEAYRELYKLIESDEDPIGIFSMLMWELRNIAMAKLNSAARVQPKFMGIAKKFSEEELKYLYTEFYQLDKNVKLGLLLQDILVPNAIEKVLCLKHT